MKNIVCLLALFVGLSAFRPAVDLKPIDASKAVTFSINNFGIAVKGEFKGIKGNIKWVPENLSSSSFNVSVDAGTIDTGNDLRDSHLRKDEYFDVAKFPSIIFSTTNITAGANGQYTATGTLTIKSTTKNISIPFTVQQSGGDYVFTSDFSINRRDYEVGGSSMVMSDNVKVSLKVTAKR